MTEEIRFRIEKDGKVALQVTGRPGSKCLEVTQAFEGNMGAVLDRRRTHEFYQPAKVPVVIKHRNPPESD